MVIFHGYVSHNQMVLSNPGDWLMLFNIERRLDRSPSSGNLSSRTPNRWEVEIKTHPAGPHFSERFCVENHWEIQTNCRHIIYLFHLISLPLYISGLSIYLSNYLCLSIYLSNLNYLSIYFCLSLPLCLCLLSLSSYLSETAWGNQASW